MSACKCSDCTRCPYDWCIDEDKDNGEVVKKDARAYYQANRVRILERAKARREYRKAHGICVRCSRPAVKGVYCPIHAEYSAEKNKYYYARKAK